MTYGDAWPLATLLSSCRVCDVFKEWYVIINHLYLPSFLISFTGIVVHASVICKQDKLAVMDPAQSKDLHPCFTPGPNHASHWLLPLYLFCSHFQSREAHAGVRAAGPCLRVLPVSAGKAALARFWGCMHLQGRELQGPVSVYCLSAGCKTENLSMK